jgi:hypothetical protein
MIIFLDESGDLGFDATKQGSSKKFVITLLVCESESVAHQIKTAGKRTLKNKLNHKKKSRVIHELKGTGTTLTIKKYWHHNLPNNGWAIYTVSINKSRVDEHLTSKSGKKKFYNFMARFILEKVDSLQTTKHVRLVVDKCKNREEMKDFNRYVENQLQAMMPLNASLHIEHESSQNSHGLQAVDLFCWGIFRKYECNDKAWYSVYRSSIVFETEYFR